MTLDQDRLGSVRIRYIWARMHDQCELDNGELGQQTLAFPMTSIRFPNGTQQG